MQGGFEKIDVCLQGDLMIARGLIGGCHRVIVVWGVGLMEHKEELKQQTAALQWNLMIATMLLDGYHRVIVFRGEDLMECK